jgi:hydrogenase-4 component D
LANLFAIMATALPLLSGLVTFLAGGKRECELIAGLSSSATFALVLLTAVSLLMDGPSEEIMVSFGSIRFYSIIVDYLSVLVAIAVSLVGLLIIIFSFGYMSPDNREHPVNRGFQRYYGMMQIFMGSMLGFVFSGTFLGLILFFEMTGICSWILIAFWHEEKESRVKATKALLFTHAGEIFLVAAAALTIANTGDLSVSSLKLLDEGMRGMVMLLILVAAWAKSAQIPFYSWLPDAMIAPTPVSAYLHAAAMVKVGVYLLARTIPSSLPLPPTVPLIAGIFSTATMIWGLLLYFPQVDMKRLLAYSTITQLSYMFLGLSFAMLGSAQGYSGAIMHLFNHAFSKGLFFLVAGALAASTGSRFLTDYSGIFRRNRLLGASFVIATISIAGVPPFNCFFSKFTIISAGFLSGGIFTVLGVVAIVESVLCFIWFLRWLQKCVMGEESDVIRSSSRMRLSMSASLLLLSIFCFISQYIAMEFLPRGVWPW